MLTAIQLAEMYQRVVQEGLGLLATVDDDGDVAFRHPDLGHMFFDINARDPEFMRLVYPRFVDETELSVTHEALLQAINDTNRRCKGVKLFFDRAHDAEQTPRVCATIEAFVAASDTAPSAALLFDVISRCISAIRNGAFELCRTVQGEEQDGDVPAFSCTQQ